MKSNWQHLSLREAGISLIDCVHKTPEAKDDGYPYVAIPQMKEGRINFSSTRKISHEDFLAWTVKAKPEAYDIVISRRCNPGESAYVPEGVEFALGQNLVLLRSDGKKVYKPYLRWLLNSPFWWAEVRKFINVGAVFTSLKCGDVPNFSLPIPPLDEQIKISDILHSLDNKIEINHKINQNLESMAQAIFKSWFVDFDPVKAKLAAIEAGEDAEGVTRAAMRAISGKTDDELDQLQAEQPEHYVHLKTTAGLFPSAMQDSELGGVPEGWEVKQIGDVVKVVGGGTPSTKNSAFWDGGSHCWTTPKDLSGISSHVLLDTVRKITDAGLAKISCGLLPAGTFLLSSRAPVGYTAIAKVPLAVNQGYIAIPPGGQLSSIFLLHWTRVNLEIIKGRACGTTFQEISKKNFRPIKIAVATTEILNHFDRAVGRLFERIVANEQESRSLTAIRDALLPKLMSGKIRVK